MKRTHVIHFVFFNHFLQYCTLLLFRYHQDSITKDITGRASRAAKCNIPPNSMKTGLSPLPLPGSCIGGWIVQIVK